MVSMFDITVLNIIQYKLQETRNMLDGAIEMASLTEPRQSDGSSR